MSTKKETPVLNTPSGQDVPRRVDGRVLARLVDRVTEVACIDIAHARTSAY